MKFYVYEHWRPDLDLPFYVGKGKGRRGLSFKRQNRQHQFVMKKLARMGMCAESRMVASGLSESDAFRIERERIAFWRASDVRLTNVADGGGGSAGFKHTEEFKEKARAIFALHNANRGPISDETRQKMRAAKVGRKLSPDHIAKVAAAGRGRKYGPRTPEHRAAISASKIGTRATAETRAKMSVTRTGKKIGPVPPERAARISASLKGRPWSQKRRTAHTARFRRPQNVDN